MKINNSMCNMEQLKLMETKSKMVGTKGQQGAKSHDLIDTGSGVSTISHQRKKTITKTCMAQRNLES